MRIRPPTKIPYIPIRRAKCLRNTAGTKCPFALAATRKRFTFGWKPAASLSGTAVTAY